jgi:hypothetical protein
MSMDTINFMHKPLNVLTVCGVILHIQYGDGYKLMSCNINNNS